MDGTDLSPFTGRLREMSHILLIYVGKACRPRKVNLIEGTTRPVYCVSLVPSLIEQPSGLGLGWFYRTVVACGCT